ncbi:hypothetical protein X975_04997, partial [Stegodyphus mimosarum]
KLIEVSQIEIAAQVAGKIFGKLGFFHSYFPKYYGLFPFISLNISRFVHVLILYKYIFRTPSAIQA